MLNKIAILILAILIVVVSATITRQPSQAPTAHPTDPTATPTLNPSKSPYTDFCIAHDYDPLPCLLSSIEFNLITSPICFNGTNLNGTKELEGKFCIDFLTCGSLLFGALPSDYLHPTSLRVGAVDLGFSCEGNLTVER